MLEMLLDPRRAERKPWELFFIGMLYAGLSLLLANWLFAGNPVFAKHISILTITFTVMFSLPFFYFIIKLEERKSYRGERKSFIGEHGNALSALMWLFLGFVVAYSFVYIAFPEISGETFSAQIEQYCSINMPSQIDQCVDSFITGNYGLTGGASTTKDYAMSIFVNNIYVLIFSILFSLIFGAGAIFILAWNASVIAAAIGIFAQSSLANFPVALSRYMIHGLPEIGSYFVAALAGGIIGVALIRHEVNSKKFWDTMRDSFNLILIAIGLLIIGVLIEAFVTPKLF
ncbi:stage II sporulation protein M [Nanoarchaeota archaeon]